MAVAVTEEVISDAACDRACDQKSGGRVSCDGPDGACDQKRGRVSRDGACDQKSGRMSGDGACDQKSGARVSARALLLPHADDLPIAIAPAPIADFLDKLDGEASAAWIEALTVPRNILEKGFPISVVSPFDRRTYCFTGGYGRLVDTSTGSLLLHRGDRVEQKRSLTEFPLDRSDPQALVRELEGNVRFFSPSELLRLFDFPLGYSFPPHLSPAQCYKLIGNSINVRVVRCILQHHLQGPLTVAS